MNKAQFVKTFSDFLKNNVSEFHDLKSLVYVDDNNREWLYVNYNSYSQKRIDISMDSDYSIMMDFFKHVEDAPWLVDKFDEDIYNS